MKENLIFVVVVAVLAPVIFCVMRILFGQVVFEPYIVSQMFSIAVAFFVMVGEDVKGMAWGWALALTFIIAFAFSAELYWVADMMNASQLEYFNSRAWDACPSSPDLPNITWGWSTQSIISAVIATIYITIVVIYKITKKVEAE